MGLVEIAAAGVPHEEGLVDHVHEECGRCELTGGRHLVEQIGLVADSVARGIEGDARERGEVRLGGLGGLEDMAEAAVGADSHDAPPLGLAMGAGANCFRENGLGGGLHEVADQEEPVRQTREEFPGEFSGLERRNHILVRRFC